MSTRLELLAAAFPLHYQRIVEAAFADGGQARLDWFMRDAASWQNARIVLRCAFCYSDTAEGHVYWEKLAFRR